MTLLDVDRSGSLDAVVAQAGTAEAVSGDAQEGIVEVHAFLDMNASELTLTHSKHKQLPYTLCAELLLAINCILVDWSCHCCMLSICVVHLFTYLQRSSQLCFRLAPNL